MSQSFVLHKDSTRASVRDRLVRFLDMLPDDSAWLVEIKRHARRRSDQQNRYLNGVAYKMLSDATGYERDDISEYLCGQYFGWKDKRVPGRKIVQIPARTTTVGYDGRRSVLTSAEFSDYVEFVQRFGAEHGVYIPDPDPFYEQEGA